MKKILLFMTAMVSVLFLNGCNGGYYDDPYDYSYDDGLTTLFLVDEYGNSYANIPYKCDSMTRWSKTAYNGEFSFMEPDSCKFDFNGLDGIYGDMQDDIVRIVDDINRGKGGIPYDCTSFRGVSTYDDGSFDYDQDDICVFYL
jgi:hypothetical protein